MQPRERIGLVNFVEALPSRDGRRRRARLDPDEVRVRGQLAIWAAFAPQPQPMSRTRASGFARNTCLSRSPVKTTLGRSR